MRIIGNLPTDISAELKTSGIKYENAFGLTDAEMRTEYEKADIVAYCSNNEGFVLPIIEGQIMKTPVITSDLSPLKEVSGGAAFLANPLDISSIRNGILKIINDAEFRKNIVKKGSENVKKYELNYIVELYENLYDKILREG